ncbi:DUF6431 domain-containing protein [Bacillus sp. OV166]|uniref:DUF6431 domain-containing protein n=1 Tax=Bacillus sp. OV166 TaxID=1882763 RepID=UPI00211AD1DE|nr:DUF6431 domain-containing protein [Bacillus sp. OV166]
MVRGAGRIPSPCCGKSMSVIGTRNRKSRERSGESKVYNIRRLECDDCGRVHHELPDFLVPNAGTVPMVRNIDTKIVVLQKFVSILFNFYMTCIIMSYKYKKWEKITRYEIQKNQIYYSFVN